MCFFRYGHKLGVQCGFIPLSKNFFDIDDNLAFSLKDDHCNRRKGAFSRWKKKESSYPSALLGDPRIFAERMQIIQYFDPYSIPGFHYNPSIIGSVRPGIKHR